MYLENPNAAVRLCYLNVLPVLKSQKYAVFTTQVFLIILDALRLLNRNPSDYINYHNFSLTAYTCVSDGRDMWMSNKEAHSIFCVISDGSVPSLMNI